MRFSWVYSDNICSHCCTFNSWLVYTTHAYTNGTAAYTEYQCLLHIRTMILNYYIQPSVFSIQDMDASHWLVLCVAWVLDSCQTQSWRWDWTRIMLFLLHCSCNVSRTVSNAGEICTEYTENRTAYNTVSTVQCPPLFFRFCGSHGSGGFLGFSFWPRHVTYFPVFFLLWGASCLVGLHRETAEAVFFFVVCWGGVFLSTNCSLNGDKVNTAAISGILAQIHYPLIGL